MCMVGSITLPLISSYYIPSILNKCKNENGSYIQFNVIICFAFACKHSIQWFISIIIMIIMKKIDKIIVVI